MRKVFVVVERRADYSRYKPILEKIVKDSFFELYLVVTGVCLLKEHGNDVENIEKDGFKINSKIPMFKNKRPDNGAEMISSTARIMSKLADELEKSKPDLVLSGFDIGANFAVTVAAAHMNIPVFHIQGGEVTGSIDESLRHAMSKFAHVHFPATELSKERLIKMGENPKNIYVVGCPSIDIIINTPIISKNELEKEFNIDLLKSFVLLLQHPVTTEIDLSMKQIKETIDAIKELNIQCLAILPNNDAGYSKIINKIKKSGLKWCSSLSMDKYINLCKYASALIGNSSSGIHETSTLKLPTVNIGNRQMGRERAGNVIDVPNKKKEIKRAIERCLYDKEFINYVKTIKNPYGDGTSAEKIVEILKVKSLAGIIQKQFYE